MQDTPRPVTVPKDKTEIRLKFPIKCKCNWQGGDLASRSETLN